MLNHKKWSCVSIISPNISGKFHHDEISIITTFCYPIIPGYITMEIFHYPIYYPTIIP